VDGKQVSLRLRQLVGFEIRGFAEAFQKAAGDLFSAIHVVPRTAIEPGQPKKGVNEMVRRRVGFGSAVYIRRIIT